MGPTASQLRRLTILTLSSQRVFSVFPQWFSVIAIELIIFNHVSGPVCLSLKMISFLSESNRWHDSWTFLSITDTQTPVTWAWQWGNWGSNWNQNLSLETCLSPGHSLLQSWSYWWLSSDWNLHLGLKAEKGEISLIKRLKGSFTHLDRLQNLPRLAKIPGCSSVEAVGIGFFCMFQHLLWKSWIR